MDPRKNSKRQGTRSQGLSKVRRQLKSFFLSSFSQFDVSTNKKKKQQKTAVIDQRQL